MGESSFFKEARLERGTTQIRGRATQSLTGELGADRPRSRQYESDRIVVESSDLLQPPYLS